MCLCVLKKTVAIRSLKGHGKLFLLHFDWMYHIQHRKHVRVELVYLNRSGKNAEMQVVPRWIFVINMRKISMTLHRPFFYKKKMFTIIQKHPEFDWVWENRIWLVAFQTYLSAWHVDKCAPSHRENPPTAALTSLVKETIQKNNYLSCHIKWVEGFILWVFVCQALISCIFQRAFEWNEKRWDKLITKASICPFLFMYRF